MCSCRAITSLGAQSDSGTAQTPGVQQQAGKGASKRMGKYEWLSSYVLTLVWA